MKFNKASEVLRDYLNQKEIISLLERGENGSLNGNEKTTYDEIMEEISNNKKKGEELNENIRILKHNKDEDISYDSCEN
tara:strand:+ start:377 stop:613 length:237 start_codon:yes stop_codon:yes gene_type:complete